MILKHSNAVLARSANATTQLVLRTHLNESKYKQPPICYNALAK